MDRVDDTSDDECNTPSADSNKIAILSYKHSIIQLMHSI